MLARALALLVVVHSFGVTVARAGDVVPPHRLPPSTFDELAKFDSRAEFNRSLDRRPKFVSVVAPKAAALEWSCKLSDTVLTRGELLQAEITVKNPSDFASFQLAPPPRGFFVANLQVWVRAEGDKLFRTHDGWKSYHGKTPRSGPAVRLAPGETRRWTSRLDHLPGLGFQAPKPDDRWTENVFWPGGVMFPKAGKYEVVVRYVNPQLPVERLNGDAEREEPVGARVFGPYKVTVLDRPESDPNWVADLWDVWTFDRPRDTDVIAGPSRELVDRIAKIPTKEVRAVGTLGDDVILWRLLRQWPDLWFDKNEDRIREQLEVMADAVRELPANHPNRAAVELLRAATCVKMGDSKALRIAFLSSDPDIQLFAILWAESLERQAERQKK